MPQPKSAYCAYRVFELGPKDLNHPVPVHAHDPAPALGDGPPAVVPAQHAGQVDHVALVPYVCLVCQIPARPSPLVREILDVTACSESSLINKLTKLWVQIRLIMASSSLKMDNYCLREHLV